MPGDNKLFVMRLLPEATLLNRRNEGDPGSLHCCDMWNETGNTAFAEGNWSQALAAYSKAISLGYQYHHYIHFDCAALFSERAKLYLDSGDETAALRDVKESLFQDHDNTLKNWQPGESFPRYDKADPLENNWQHNIALTDSDTGLIEGIKGHLEQKYFHPDIGRYRDLHQRARVVGTISAYDEALAAAVDFHHYYHRHAAQHHINRGLVYFRISQFDMALNDFSKACDLDKGLAIAWKCRGDARTALGNTQGAKLDYDRARRLTA